MPGPVFPTSGAGGGAARFLLTDETYGFVAPISQTVGGLTANPNIAKTLSVCWITPFILPVGAQATAMSFLNVSTAQAATTVTCFLLDFSETTGKPTGIFHAVGAGVTLAATGQITDTFAAPYTSDGNPVYGGYWTDATTAQVDSRDVANQDLMPFLGSSVSGAVLGGYTIPFGFGTYSQGTAPELDAGDVYGPNNLEFPVLRVKMEFP